MLALSCLTQNRDFRLYLILPAASERCRVGRDLRGLPGPIPTLRQEQGYLEQARQILIDEVESAKSGGGFAHGLNLSTAEKFCWTDVGNPSFQH